MLIDKSDIEEAQASEKPPRGRQFWHF